MDFLCSPVHMNFCYVESIQDHVSRFNVLVLMWFFECVGKCVVGEMNIERTSIYLQGCFLLIKGQTSGQ